MRKFLNKSLIIAASSLCALNTSVEASSFKADKMMDYDGAIESAKDQRKAVKSKIYKYQVGENAFIDRNAPGTIKKWKDTIVNFLTLGASMFLGGYAGVEVANSNNLNKNAEIFGAAGAGLGGLIVGPTVYRNIKNAWQNEELLRNTYAMATLADAKTVAEGAHMMKKAEEKGDLTL